VPSDILGQIPVEYSGSSPRPWYGAFLRGLQKLGTVTKACEFAGISMRQAEQWKKDDPAFAACWREALRAFWDDYEVSTMDVPARGLRRKKFTAKGEPIIDPATGEQYFEVEYNTSAALARLRSARPEYRSQAPPPGAPVQVMVNMADPATLAALLASAEAQTLPYSGTATGHTPPPEITPIPISISDFYPTTDTPPLNIVISTSGGASYGADPVPRPTAPPAAVEAGDLPPRPAAPAPPRRGRNRGAGRNRNR
jgi:hypothetical protein